MQITMSKGVRTKLADKHKVTEKEVQECFMNRTACDLFDTRAEHHTDPKTRWFIAPTNRRRLLKVVYIPDIANKAVIIKTAYDPNAEELRIYSKFAR